MQRLREFAIVTATGVVASCLSISASAADVQTLAAKRTAQIESLLQRPASEMKRWEQELLDIENLYNRLATERGAALSKVPPDEQETFIEKDEDGKKRKETDKAAVARNRLKSAERYRINTIFGQAVAPLEQRKLKVAAERLQLPNTLQVEWSLVGDRFGRLTAAEHRASIASLDRAVLSEPDNPYCLLARALAQRRIGSTEKALADLDEVVESTSPPKKVKNPNVHAAYVTALSARADLHLAEGRTALAMKDFGNALAIVRIKDHSDYYLFRALAECRQGKFGEAAAKLVKGTKLHADDPESHRLLALFYATCPVTARRETKKSLDAAQKACQLTKSQCWACLYALAAAHAEGNHFDEAAKTVAQAAELTIDEHRDECLRCQKLYEAKQPLRLDWK